MAKPIIAKDFLGNTLEIGDTVISIGSGHDPLYNAKITRFTPKMADLACIPIGNSTYSRKLRQFHWQMIKVNTVENTEKLLGDFFDTLARLPKGVTAGSMNREDAVKDFLRERMDKQK